MLLKLKYLDELGEQTSWKLTRHSDQAVDCGVSSNRKRGTAEFNVCCGPQPNSCLKITTHSFVRITAVSHFKGWRPFITQSGMFRMKDVWGDQYF